MNTKKICRCCLALDVPLLSIYDAGGSAGSGCVADMLKQIAKVKPQPNDNMPDKTCLQCISEINRCFVFKMKCENSNRTLRQLLPDAVPEPIDYDQQKPILTSSTVQTEDKIFVSSLVQTITVENPFLRHNSMQTMAEEKPLVSTKEVQTEIEFRILTDPQIDDIDEDSVTESSIITYENVETPIRKLKNSSKISWANRQKQEKLPVEAQLEDIYEDSARESAIITDEKDETLIRKRKNSSKTSWANRQKKVELSIENIKSEDLLPVEETQHTHKYILLEESNIDSEVTKIYIERHVEGEEESDYQRFEYCDENEEVNEGHDNEAAKTMVYETVEYIQSDCHIASLETVTKPQTSTNNCLKSSRISGKFRGEYKCMHCIMTFVSLKVLQRHLMKMHDVRDIDEVVYVSNNETTANLEELSSADNSRSKLSNSNAELNLENVAKPKLMPREKMSSSLFNEEMLTNAKYFCEYCQTGFAQRKTYTYHVKHKICMSNNFKCNKCERIFVSEENLEDHIHSHENPHKCLDCEKVCKTMDELSQHMIDEHNRSARNQCHICKKVFTMKTSLNDHLRIHSGEKPFLCTICGKSFRQNSNLRQHLIRHTNEKNFKCDMCPNAYVTKSELFSHKRIHTGDQPFKCDTCQARFTTSCSLRKHLRKHTGERPYACELCPLRFATLNVLKNHIRVHTGEKPYKCAFCPKCFSQKGDCLMHERSHTNQDFKCFCKSKFTKKFNLRQHLKTQHTDLSENEIKDLLEGTENCQITLMKKHNNDTKLKYKTDSGVTDTLITVSQESDINTNTNNTELLEIVVDNVG